MFQEEITIEPWQIAQALERGRKARSRTFIEMVRRIAGMFSFNIRRPVAPLPHAVCHS